MAQLVCWPEGLARAVPQEPWGVRSHANLLGQIRQAKGWFEMWLLPTCAKIGIFIREMMASEIQMPSRCHPMRNPQLEYRHLPWILQQEQCPMQMPILQLRVAHWMVSGRHLEGICVSDAIIALLKTQFRSPGTCGSQLLDSPN